MSNSTTLTTVGGENGGSFSFTGEDSGASLNKIWVWEGIWQIKAVKVILSDGREKTFGEVLSSTKSPKKFRFSPGECFTSLSLWENGEGTRLGGIKFKTNKSRKFFAKMTKGSLPKEVHIEVGSGFCMGIEGRYGSDIDRMGFVFLNSVESVVLTNVSYPTIDQLIPQVALDEFKSATYKNKSCVTQQQEIKTSKTVSKKCIWSMKENFSAAFKTEVKAGIPQIVEGVAGFSVSVGAESFYGLEHTEETTETLTTTVDVQPKKKVVVKMSIGRATFDLPYDGTIKITCKNNSVVEYKMTGTYKGITCTDIKVNIEDFDL